MRKQVIEVCLSPALFPYYHQQGQIVVVIDIFRATSVICTALANGALSVKPVSEVEEALSYRSKGYLLAGERHRKKIDGFDFGNSPEEFKSKMVAGKHIAFTTTNGTQAIQMANTSEKMIAASFLNIGAVSNYLPSQNKPVLLLCAGWKNKFCWEDTLFAGLLARPLIESKRFIVESDAMEFVLSVSENQMDLKSFLLEKSPQFKEAMPLLVNDVDYCLSMNLMNLVPELVNGSFIKSEFS